MGSNSVESPERGNHPRRRDHVPSAAGARTLIARLLEEPVVSGRRGEALATADAHVALAVLSLTFGYGKTTDRFAMAQVVEMTGYGPRKVAGALQRLNAAGVLSYQPADRLRGRPLGRVSLPTAPSPGPGRGPGEPVVVVGRSVRRLIDIVLGTRHTLALVRVTLAVIAQLPTWLQLEDAIGRDELADATGLNPETAGRKLKQLAELGALVYVPGRGRGRRSRVRLLEPVRRQVATPPAAVQLRGDERHRLNAFFRPVLADLEAQEPGQSAAFVAAVQTMAQRDRFARMVLQVLDAGQEHALSAALTTAHRPGAPTYRGSHDLAGAIFARVRHYLDAHGPGRRTSGPASGAGTSSSLASILRPALTQTAWAGMVLPSVRESEGTREGSREGTAGVRRVGRAGPAVTRP